MSTVGDILQELTSLTPLPPDEEIDERHAFLLDRYQRLLEMLEGLSGTEAFEPARVIPVLLESFSIGDGYGVYWSALHLLESLGEAIYPYIYAALTSPNPGTRGWSCYLLGRRRVPGDLIPLIPVLQDAHHFVQKQAIQAVEMIGQQVPIPPAIFQILLTLQTTSEEIIQVAAGETIDRLRKLHEPNDEVQLPHA